MQSEIFVGTLHCKIAQEMAGHKHHSGTDIAASCAIFTMLFINFMVEARLNSGPQIGSFDDTLNAGAHPVGHVLSANSEHLELFVCAPSAGLPALMVMPDDPILFV